MSSVRLANSFDKAASANHHRRRHDANDDCNLTLASDEIGPRREQQNNSDISGLVLSSPLLVHSTFTLITQQRQAKCITLQVVWPT